MILSILLMSAISHQFLAMYNCNIGNIIANIDIADTHTAIFYHQIHVTVIFGVKNNSDIDILITNFSISAKLLISKESSFDIFQGVLFRGLPPRPGPRGSWGPATPPGPRRPSKTTSTISGSRWSSRRRSRPGSRARKATSGLRTRSTGPFRWIRPRPSPLPRASGMEVRGHRLRFLLVQASVLLEEYLLRTIRDLRHNRFQRTSALYSITQNNTSHHRYLYCLMFL